MRNSFLKQITKTNCLTQVFGALFRCKLPFSGQLPCLFQHESYVWAHPVCARWRPVLACAHLEFVGIVLPNIAVDLIGPPPFFGMSNILSILQIPIPA